MADPKLTPARRAVLMGLYEGRALVRSSGGWTWKDDGFDLIRSHEINWLDQRGLIDVVFNRNRPPLTPTGRALAERLAQEGR